MHEAHKPNALVDLSDAGSLTASAVEMLTFLHCMHKDKSFREVAFSADALREAVQAFGNVTAAHGVSSPKLTHASVEHDGATWNHDDLNEFYSDYRRGAGQVHLQFVNRDLGFAVLRDLQETTVRVEAPTRAEIESVFEVFEKHVATSKLPPAPAPPKPRPVIFIGHGRHDTWRDLKDHLQDKHGYEVEAYETGARAGHTIRDVLEQMASRSSFALLVLTAEDAMADGEFRARQNVVHETGLFQGRLGFTRAVVLLEEGTQKFSNIDGIQWLPFAKGNIKEVFGDVLAVLRREFGT